MNKAEMLNAMTRTTGLSRSTIKDLMKNGWFYEEKDGRASFYKKVNN